MSDVKNMHNELNPRVQQMLDAYAITPKRDSESARRTQVRFMAELDKFFVEPVASTPATRGSIFPDLDQLRENLARLFAKRSTYLLMTALLVLGVYMFSGVAITAYAASSALPGDPLYALKTTTESIRANLTLDSAEQSRLYMGLAGQRLLEIQSLIRKGRYDDIPRAASEFEEDIQKSLIAIKSLSQVNPHQAADIKTEFAPILRSYSDILTQMLGAIPRDVQTALQSAINASNSAAGHSDDDDNAGSSTPIPTTTATPADVLLTPIPGGSTPLPAPVPGGDNDGSAGDDAGGNNNSGGGEDDDGGEDGRGDENGNDDGRGDDNGSSNGGNNNGDDDAGGDASGDDESGGDDGGGNSSSGGDDNGGDDDGGGDG